SPPPRQPASGESRRPHRPWPPAVPGSAACGSFRRTPAPATRAAAPQGGRARSRCASRLPRHHARRRGRLLTGRGEWLGQARYAWLQVPRAETRDARTLRSTLPFWLSGSSSSTRQYRGTLYASISSRICPRTCSGVMSPTTTSVAGSPPLGSRTADDELPFRLRGQSVPVGVNDEDLRTGQRQPAGSGMVELTIRWHDRGALALGQP